jgi:DNA modification methylase
MIDLVCGNCLDVLRSVPSGSVNAVVSDPPYPEIKRDYGMLSEAEWHDLMRGVVEECRRVLVADGSAVFFLQPNSKHVGEMRTWLWEFLAWAGKEWNLVQDVWWFNPSAQPNVHSQRKFGLMRPSVKMCVWLGSPKCYRNQDEVLLPLKITEHNGTNELLHKPSGYTMRVARCLNTSIERGGSTPYNMLKFANVFDKSCAGAYGHGAGTPYKLTDWWVRYISRPGDLVLDPFSGAGTTAIACYRNGRNHLGVEQMEQYHLAALERLKVS